MSLLLLLPGCKRDTVYEHAPSERWSETLEANSDVAAPFTHNGVVVFPKVTWQGHNKVILLWCYSKEPTSVTVRQVRVTGVGAQANESRESAIEQVVPVERSVEDGAWYKNALTHLMEIPIEEFAALAKDGAKVDLKLLFPGDGETPTDLAYAIDTRTVSRLPMR